MVSEERILLEKAVRKRYKPGVYGMKRVAAEFGVSTTTVQRILHPEKAERWRKSSREAKRRRTGICEDCGGVTHYNGRAGRKVSSVCARCQREREKAAKVWTRDAVIAAIQRWAAEHGEPPSATDWLNARDGYPCAKSVYRSESNSSSPFRFWADAIETAGFERPELGGRYRERPRLWKFDHAEAMRLLGEGLTQTAVAQQLGVSTGSISQLAQQGGSYAKRRA